MQHTIEPSSRCIRDPSSPRIDGPSGDLVYLLNRSALSAGPGHGKFRKIACDTHSTLHTSGVWNNVIDSSDEELVLVSTVGKVVSGG